MDLLIKGAYALIRKGKGEYIAERADILIDGGRIAGIAPDLDNCTADVIIDGKDKFAIPGLINCHTHAYMTCLRGLADDLPFHEWLFEKVMPNEEKLTPDDAYYSSLLGCAEMLLSGTTAFLEMHMFKGMVARAALSAGIRCVLSRGLSGTLTSDGGMRRVDEAIAEMEEFGGEPLLSFAFGPHAIYTTDTDYLKYISLLARKKDIPVHIHLSESVKETEDCIEKYGRTPVEYLDSIGMFENRVIAAHCANVTDNDITILAERKVNVVLNIRSNMKLGNGVPPVGKMFDAGINLCLGTDSAASNNSLNMFNELASVSLISKGADRSSTRITASQALDMATFNASLALGLDSGELAVGKKADIVLLDLKRPSLTPRTDLVSSLCYSANGSEVDTVIVDGKIRVKGGRPLNIDMSALMNETEIITHKFKEKN